jgi:hypothetical protein
MKAIRRTGELELDTGLGIRSSSDPQTGRRLNRRVAAGPPRGAHVQDGDPEIQSGAAQPEVVQLDREQGRALVDRRSRHTLGMGVDEFLTAYDAGLLDLHRREVQDLALLIPFAR